MKKIILSVMMVFALGTVGAVAQTPAKGCGGCKQECTAQQKAECHGTETKKEKKEECTKKECTKKECDKTKKECDKKEVKKPACCKKEAAKK